jgi:polyhydroxyalkanoate synthesis regulator phasin
MTYMALFRTLHEELFAFLFTSEYSALSNETQFALRNLVKKFTKDFELALIPTWQYGYCVHIYKDLYKTLANVFGISHRESNKYPSWFVFLKYPNIEANNILLNCVFSHEIAHFNDYLNNISQRLLKDIKINQEEFEKYLEDLFKQKISGSEEAPAEEKGQTQLTFGDIWNKETVRQEIFARISKIIENWLKEIVADLLALRTFGPAFLFSLIESSVILQVLDSYSDSHPASSWRIKYCIEELYSIGFKENAANESIKKYIEDWEKYTVDAGKGPIYPHHRISFISIKAAFPVIQEYLQLVSKPFTFNTVQYKEISRIIKMEYLLKGIPPVAGWEKDCHMYFNNIYTLNAAWEVFLTEKDKFYENFEIDGIDGKLKANEMLNKLALKAVESSDILRLWKEAE